MRTVFGRARVAKICLFFGMREREREKKTKTTTTTTLTSKNSDEYPRTADVGKNMFDFMFLVFEQLQAAQLILLR